MTLLKKTALTAIAIATISFASLGAGTTEANAGWKKHKFHHHFKKHYSYNYGYHCEPKYRKIWVWSPRKGRKIKRWVRVGKYCGKAYYGY